MAGHPNGIFELYRSENKEWYWQLKAVNNRTIAVGGEGFKTKQGAIHGIYAVAEYVTKQVMGSRGMHCDICEVDNHNHEIDYPKPRREYEMVVANEDEAGASVVRDPSAVLAMEASIKKLSEDDVAMATPGEPNPTPTPGPPLTSPPKKKRAAKKKVTKKVTRRIKVPDTDPNSKTQRIIEETVKKIQNGDTLPNLKESLGAPRPDPIAGGVLESDPEIDDTLIGETDTSKMSANEFAKWQETNMAEGNPTILPARIKAD